jgi:type II secretory pathway pseudopilin PulG
MCPPTRKGYTVLEVVIVIAVLIVLGGVLVPTLSSYNGNTRQKATADLIRARIVEGRAKAMEQGAWYRLAISQDNSRIRLAPDGGVGGTDFSSLTPGDPDAPDAKVVEDKLDHATAELILDPSDTRTPDGNWLTIMTVGPEGICKENNTTISIKEAEFQPIFIQVRGIVGSSAIVPPPKNGTKQ